MIKCICDKCGKETTKVTECKKYINNTKYDLCPDCYEKFRNFYTHTKNVDIENFMRLTDQEIDLLHYQFKVGDKVFTADGREGVITSICTCDKCKERGFYEPTAKMDNGDILYITNGDKYSGFEDFFQIGDYVFDNIDEDGVKDKITACKKRLKQLNAQLALIEVLKYAKEKE